MKNIIFEKNNYNETHLKYSNLFKSSFVEENLEKFKIEDCNTFLCSANNNSGYENLNLDEYFLID